MPGGEKPRADELPTPEIEAAQARIAQEDFEHRVQELRAEEEATVAALENTQVTTGDALLDAVGERIVEQDRQDLARKLGKEEGSEDAPQED